MKRLLTLILASVLMSAIGAACEKSGVIVTENKISNLLESDIVVELGVKNKQVITITPGEIRTIYSNKYNYKGGRPESSMTMKVLELSEPVMKIGGETMPDLIWMREYWDYDGSDVNDPTYFKVTHTLIVTDELIETIKQMRL